jgi:hypothetical protein
VSAIASLVAQITETGAAIELVSAGGQVVASIVESAIASDRAYWIGVSGERVLVVPYENRVLVIPYENRSISVPAESRSLSIGPESRSIVL